MRKHSINDLVGAHKSEETFQRQKLMLRQFPRGPTNIYDDYSLSENMDEKSFTRWNSAKVLLKIIQVQKVLSQKKNKKKTKEKQLSGGAKDKGYQCYHSDPKEGELLRDRKKLSVFFLF